MFGSRNGNQQNFQSAGIANRNLAMYPPPPSQEQDAFGGLNLRVPGRHSQHPRMEGPPPQRRRSRRLSESLKLPFPFNAFMKYAPSEEQEASGYDTVRKRRMSSSGPPKLYFERRRSRSGSISGGVGVMAPPKRPGDGYVSFGRVGEPVAIVVDHEPHERRSRRGSMSYPMPEPEHVSHHRSRRSSMSQSRRELDPQSSVHSWRQSIPPLESAPRERESRRSRRGSMYQGPEELEESEPPRPRRESISHGRLESRRGSVSHSRPMAQPQPQLQPPLRMGRGSIAVEKSASGTIIHQKNEPLLPTRIGGGAMSEVGLDEAPVSSRTRRASGTRSRPSSNTIVHEHNEPVRPTRQASGSFSNRMSSHFSTYKR